MGGYWECRPCRGLGGAFVLQDNSLLEGLYKSGGNFCTQASPLLLSMLGSPAPAPGSPPKLTSSSLLRLLAVHREAFCDSSACTLRLPASAPCFPPAKYASQPKHIPSRRHRLCSAGPSAIAQQTCFAQSASGPQLFSSQHFLQTAHVPAAAQRLSNAGLSAIAQHACYAPCFSHPALLPTSLASQPKHSSPCPLPLAVRRQTLCYSSACMLCSPAFASPALLLPTWPPNPNAHVPAAAAAPALHSARRRGSAASPSSRTAPTSWPSTRLESRRVGRGGAAWG